MKILAVVSGIIITLLAIYILCYHDTDKTSRIKSFVIAVMLIASGITGVSFAYMPDDETKQIIKEQRAAAEKAIEEMKGQQFIDFSGKSPEGQEVSLSDFAGKGHYVLIDFWASWCGPCKSSIPIISAADKKYRGQGLEIISVNCWDKSDDAMKEIRKGKMTWNIIITEESSATSLYHVNAIPSCFLIDSEGIIVEVGFHPNFLPDILKKYFDHDE